MINKINDLLSRVEEFAPTSAAEVEEFRIKIGADAYNVDAASAADTAVAFCK